MLYDKTRIQYQRIMSEWCDKGLIWYDKVYGIRWVLGYRVQIMYQNIFIIVSDNNSGEVACHESA